MGKAGVEGWGGMRMGIATFWGPVWFGQYVPSKSAMPTVGWRYTALCDKSIVETAMILVSL